MGRQGGVGTWQITPYVTLPIYILPSLKPYYQDAGARSRF